MDREENSGQSGRHQEQCQPSSAHWLSLRSQTSQRLSLSRCRTRRPPRPLTIREEEELRGTTIEQRDWNNWTDTHNKTTTQVLLLIFRGVWRRQLPSPLATNQHSNYLDRNHPQWAASKETRSDIDRPLTRRNGFFSGTAE